MRIEAYTQVQGLYDTKKTTKPQAKSNTSFQIICRFPAWGRTFRLPSRLWQEAVISGKI